jgi:predicted MFS family arabinose efflux permease
MLTQPVANMGRMRTDPYRRVLRVPGARSLYGLSLIARIPVTAAPTALTLRVVLGLHRNFAESGLVAASVALGAALGAPLLGRLVDQRGARTALVLTTVSQGIFWTAAAWLSFYWLAPIAFVGGALSLPAFSLSRQAIAAMLPVGDRQAGMSLDSMSVEVSYSLGPALGVVAVTQLGSATAMLVIGASLVLAGVGLIAIDPQTTSRDTAEEEAGATAVTSRSWLLAPASVAALVATFGATFALSGADISFTAAMRAFGHVSLLGVVIAVWCLASLVGGFVYGTMSRRRDPLLLLFLLAVLTIPLALAGSWWVLLLLTIPSGIFCAPLLSSTADVMARVSPPDSRGRAMGVHTSALTFGSALGAPLAGLAIDRWSPASGFVAVGVLGALLALLALALVRLRPDVRATIAHGSP